MRDDWLVLSLPAPPADRALLLVDALRRVGARAVERERDGVVALYPPADDPEALVAEARAAVRAALGRAPDIAWRRQSHAEWSARWRREQSPRRAGRLVVAPVGVDPGELRDDDVLLRLDPDVAFGTAEHPTTRMCLRLLDVRVRPGARVVDIGTGSGVLAIAAALLGAAEVMAVEADALAVEAARRNVALNGVADRVRIRAREVGPRDLRRLGRSDVVVANLQAGILLPLVPRLPGTLRRGGELILSGVVGDERDDVLDAAGEAGLVLAEEAPERGWWTGVLIRRPGA